MFLCNLKLVLPFKLQLSKLLNTLHHHHLSAWVLYLWVVLNLLAPGMYKLYFVIFKLIPRIDNLIILNEYHRTSLMISQHCFTKWPDAMAWPQWLNAFVPQIVIFQSKVYQGLCILLTVKYFFFLQNVISFENDVHNKCNISACNLVMLHLLQCVCSWLCRGVMNMSMIKEGTLVLCI